MRIRRRVDASNGNLEGNSGLSFRYLVIYGVSVSMGTNLMGRSPALSCPTFQVVAPKTLVSDSIFPFLPSDSLHPTHRSFRLASLVRVIGQARSVNDSTIASCQPGAVGRAWQIVYDLSDFVSTRSWYVVLFIPGCLTWMGVCCASTDCTCPAVRDQHGCRRQGGGRPVAGTQRLILMPDVIWSRSQRKKKHKNATRNPQNDVLV
ncbi:hypothetical protein B0T22DRAFT_8608 [Podospora appendiculata]|uniref:Uncharacterized protein n=1 Tax=Podospora appendiculata TaxID=314037 RepID=A0AAE0XFS3_9PEZI|nr:hypothetical protein B0T22DRAFT_8608 [Podospora appendiculata]